MGIPTQERPGPGRVATVSARSWRSTGAWWIAIALLTGSLVVVARTVELESVRSTLTAMRSAPAGLIAALLLYAGAFGVRALVWTRVLPGLDYVQSLAALHVSLGANHVLPLRLGEVLRVTSVVRRTRIPLDAATASTVMLRAADVVAVVGLAAALGPGVVAKLIGAWAWALLIPAAGLFLAALVWLRRISRVTSIAIRSALGTIAVGAVAAWILESGVVYAASRWAGLAISWPEAILVTAVTIAAQTVAIAPAGLGTYEAAATAAFMALGAPAGPALAAALTAHAIKTAYALVTGAIAVARPAPGLVGRLRLPARRPAPPVGGTPPPGAPVILFLPARNEEPAVASVVSRAPLTVMGRAVVPLVIDDGSTDGTARAAAAAGAEVISFGDPRGLGAAVRAGLDAAVERDAAAVAFCDADGEYAPEELAVVLAPILRGEADYVVGSRWAGRIDHMRPHRRFGNRVLTRLMRFVTRSPVTDGQSGYRALSLPAARAAEIVHDFNYAQVLTLDLLGKGFRYAEVPISYHFRTAGKSFVRLGAYLRRVLPAIYRELNDGRA